MNKETILEKYRDCEKHVDKNNQVWCLIKSIVDYICGNSDVQPKEVWLQAKEFCKKYPFLHTSQLHKCACLSESFSECFKNQGRVRLFNPKNVFDWIIKHKTQNYKLYSRLKSNNFYGMDIHE